MAEIANMGYVVDRADGTDKTDMAEMALRIFAVKKLSIGERLGQSSY